MNDILATSELLLENPFYKSILYILLSIIFAKLSDIIFSSILKRIALKTKTDLDDKIIDLLHRPIYFSILFIGFGLSALSINFSSLINFILIGILKTLVVIIWSTAIFRSLYIFVDWYSNNFDINAHFKSSLLPLFNNLSKIVIFLAAVYFLFLSWDINVTGWLASAGILAMVLGLAAKDTLANLFAGVFIMADSPYKEGDYINLDTGERGYIVSIGLRDVCGS